MGQWSGKGTEYFLCDVGERCLNVLSPENVVVPAQDKKKFDLLLGAALQFDTDAPLVRDLRLANLIAQRRARYLLAHADDFIND